MRHGSLFTGVGGLDLGFEAAGIETVWQCEINKQCRSVLAKHWPEATRYTDVCSVNGAEVTPVDVISFGSPCQDLSVAGKRAGFQDGTRSNLYFEAIRIIKEMREATDGQYPRFAVWENVRGALSSNGGADFLAALEALADLGAVDISWRVVNTANFGPPQRRVRVFVVADFRAERAGQVLSQPTRVLWNPPTIGEAGPETAGETADSVGSGGWTADSSTCSTIQAGGGERGYRVDAEGAAGGQVVWQSTRDVAWAATNHVGSGVDENFARAGHLVYKEIANCLSTSNQRIDYETETFIIESNVEPSRHGQSVYTKGRRASSVNDYETWDEGRPSPTLNVSDNTGESRATVLAVQYYDGYNQKLEDDGVYRTLRIGQDSGDFIATPDRTRTEYRVRRLTPRECERLQGWPDDHTRWADDGKEISDSARYKMAGNGISSPVAQWVGENLVEAADDNDA
jgi:DNA (cytosine-5)-methyltransferase 1